MTLTFRIALSLFILAWFTSCTKKDEILPEIKMNGDALVIINLNSPYVDAGATATDDVDGIIRVSANGSVDTNFAGNYYITYNAMDVAGNEAEATRTVVVRNEAYMYSGSYSAISVLGVDTSYYTAPITTSNTINQRVWFVGYSNIENAAVYADIRHDTIAIPHQWVNTGTPLSIHAFSGSGFIKTINDKTVFEINFSDSVSGNIYTGTAVYTRN